MTFSKNVVITAGKTGGHAFPALAVAEALLKLRPDLKIHVIHTGSPLEKEVFSREGWITYTLSPLVLAGGVSFISRLKTFLFLPLIFIRIFFLMIRIWPLAVFGTGGSISAPVLFSAFLFGRRRAAWEGNAVSGLANRYLASFLPVVFTVFPKVLNISGKKQILCGYPLRKGFNQKPLPTKDTFPEEKNQTLDAKQLPTGKRQESFFSTGSDSLEKEDGKPDGERGRPFQVLVLGGSQGASLLNQVVSKALLEESWRQDIFIFHQTGKQEFASIKEKYKNTQGIEVFSFSNH
ncbi:MAG: glycosyltransferase, partial [Bdellovibrionales bacterium]|nr:glycosyltransferase [Bdellovibrionales bacterium]